MSDTSVHPTSVLTLYLRRQGVRQYAATNSCSAQIPVRDGPGRLPPGDLLKITLVGCNTTSFNKRLVDRFGEGFEQVIGISGEYFFDEDHLVSLAIELT